VQPLLQWKSNNSSTYSQCVFVDLRIQHANAHAPQSSVACLTEWYFFTLPHKLHDFWKKVTEQKMGVLIFSTTFVRNISHSKKKWATYDKKWIFVFM